MRQIPQWQQVPQAQGSQQQLAAAALQWASQAQLQGWLPAPKTRGWMRKPRRRPPAMKTKTLQRCWRARGCSRPLQQVSNRLCDAARATYPACASGCCPCYPADLLNTCSQHCGVKACHRVDYTQWFHQWSQFHPRGANAAADTARPAAACAASDAASRRQRCTCSA
jgi:hypothetical protein